MVSLVKLFIKREFRKALEVVVFVLIRGSQNLKRERYNCYLQYLICRSNYWVLPEYHKYVLSPFT